MLAVDFEESLRSPSSLGEDGTESVEVDESGVDIPDNMSP